MKTLFFALTFAIISPTFASVPTAKKMIPTEIGDNPPAPQDPKPKG